MSILKNGLTKKGKLLKRQLLLCVCDVFVFAFTSFFSLFVRFDFNFSSMTASESFGYVLTLLPLTLISAIVIFYFFGLYNRLWEYANERELVNIIVACFVASSVQILIHFLSKCYVPRSFFPIQFMLLSFCVSFIRFSFRFVRRMQRRSSNKKKMSECGEDSSRKRTLIIGAGRAGALTLKELQESRESHNDVFCVLDDDVKIVGTYMYGVPVAGTTDEVEKFVDKYGIEEIIFAIPSLNVKKKKKILDACCKTNCRLRTLPGVYQLINGEVDIKKIRDVAIEDLLFRDPLNFNSDKLSDYYKGKRILVTGGGGSIGSELCRQVASLSPSELIIFDIYEGNAYSIQQELIRKYGGKLNMSVEIGSVRDKQRLDSLFAKYKPEIVFHAAAHKHVPLMEDCPCEAVKNNVFGTYNTANMAEKYGVEKFILISTDKAVNPTNIMGATKRLCEMIVLSRQQSTTSFSAVRFGNVLGSSGSVIPLFRKQIAEGGPVTITDKRIIRYFMTIPEASKLVMEAGAMAKKGELFVLDMGDPVRIYDLAVNMIKLSGLEPEVDIPIVEIGLRPGEKLYEELLMKTETLSKTENEMIFVEKDNLPPREEIERTVFELQPVIDMSEERVDSSYIKNAVKNAVPTFREPEELNKKAATAAEMLICK